MADYCAGCGEKLLELPSGSRVACCPDAGMYWTPHEPMPADARAFRQMTGLDVRVQTEWIDMRPSSESFGRRIEHAPLYLYRRP